MFPGSTKQDKHSHTVTMLYKCVYKRGGHKSQSQQRMRTSIVQQLSVMWLVGTQYNVHGCMSALFTQVKPLPLNAPFQHKIYFHECQI